MQVTIWGFSMANTIRFHEGDISETDAARYTGAIAIDTETLGWSRVATAFASCSSRPATGLPM